MKLEDYKLTFSKLRSDVKSYWPAATLHRAPHKPFLLLAIMDLIANNVRRECCIFAHSSRRQSNALTGCSTALARKISTTLACGQYLLAGSTTTPAMS